MRPGSLRAGQDIPGDAVPVRVGAAVLAGVLGNASRRLSLTPPVFVPTVTGTVSACFCVCLPWLYCYVDLGAFPFAVFGIEQM